MSISFAAVAINCVESSRLSLVHNQCRLVIINTKSLWGHSWVPDWFLASRMCAVHVTGWAFGFCRYKIQSLASTT